MPKQIVLLAGLHKTATTSIQRTCAANLDALKAAGFAYPLTDAGAGLVPNHTALLHFMFRRSPHQTGQAGQLRARASSRPRGPASAPGRSSTPA